MSGQNNQMAGGGNYGGSMNNTIGNMGMQGGGAPVPQGATGLVRGMDGNWVPASQNPYLVWNDTNANQQSDYNDQYWAGGSQVSPQQFNQVKYGQGAGGGASPWWQQPSYGGGMGMTSSSLYPPMSTPSGSGKGQSSRMQYPY